MARKLFAFLGTGSYGECVYELADSESSERIKSRRTKFAQAALFEVLEKSEGRIDEVVVFLTDAALDKHGSALEQDLLSVRTDVNIVPEKIMDTITAETIWELFDIVYEKIEPNDVVYFDITHGFRSFPMVVLPILHYAREVKHIEIGGIFYGNWEAREQRGDAPFALIEDLTDLLSFLDWSYGVNTFLESGRAKHLVKLAEKGRDQGIRRKRRGQRTVTVAKAMHSFSETMETCRSLSIGEQAKALNKEISKARENSDRYYRTLSALFDEVYARMEVFTEDQIMDPYYAVGWCLEHGQTQQAYTMLNEHVITALCKLLGQAPDREITRKYVNWGLADALRGYSRSDNEIEGRVLQEKTISLLKDYAAYFPALRNLRENRHDMNHAGTVNSLKDPKSPKSSGELVGELGEIYESLRPFFAEISQRLTSEVAVMQGD